MKKSENNNFKFLMLKLCILIVIGFILSLIKGNFIIILTTFLFYIAILLGNVFKYKKTKNIIISLNQP